MKQLKKVWSVALCVAVILSVMVVSAGAAFTDQKEIKHTEAVDACVALHIIGGYPDGSYRPTGNMTRGEMCKMLCVTLNGGKAPALSSAATPTYNDIAGNWAAPYIEACTKAGVVAGVGGGKFAPEDQVTGFQAAKMLLVALGYEAERENFNTPMWETNVSVRAAQAGLFQGLDDLNPSASLSRDSAAQMIWNALNAGEVEYVTQTVTDDNGQTATKVVLQDKVTGNTQEKLTLIKDKFGVDAPPAKP